MTFIIGPNGVENTEGTEASFGGGGHVKIAGNFANSGKVQVDVRANLDILGNVINSGTFSILDFATRDKYNLFENAIKELEGDGKTYVQDLYQAIQVMCTHIWRFLLQWRNEHTYG